MFNMPFTQPQQIFTFWQSMMTGQSGRMEELASQVAEAEQVAMKRTTDAIDECAKLMKASLHYNQKLASAWRTQFVDASKEASAPAAEAVAPSGATKPNVEA